MLCFVAAGLEIRTLEVVPDGVPITSPSLAKKNLVALDEQMGITLRFQNYKTSKTYGSDTTKLEVCNS